MKAYVSQKFVKIKIKRQNSIVEKDKGKENHNPPKLKLNLFIHKI
jgi:hypothetical protein